MMKRALLLYTHGIGDLIMLTPHLRKLYVDGYVCDIMCYDFVPPSHLLDECPYTDKLFVTPNPHISQLGFHKQYEINTAEWKTRAKDYDIAFKAEHPGNLCVMGIHKIDIVSKEFGFKPDSYELEIFMTPKIEAEVVGYLKEENLFETEYVFQHTNILEHDWHSWDAYEYINENFPNMPVINTGFEGNYYLWKDDINYTFALLKYSSCRVLSSSVMVHASEALGLNMEVINYGRPARHAWPKDQSKVKNIREAGTWIK